MSDGPKLPIPECCGTCHYWSPYHVRAEGHESQPTHTGDCLRFPQTVRKMANEWCGEYAPKASAPAPAAPASEDDESLRARLRLAVGSDSVNSAKIDKASGAELDQLAGFYNVTRR